ncbi:MAG: hypothetical protein U5L75_00790 [Candidatus Campbellbacteria bacterium]|nr:hypothetical protein [Candidatus Campbellbacteria bacterium]
MKEENSLRKLNAEQRLKQLEKITGLSLSIQEPTKYAKSTSYWTICKETSLPIDPIDGLELYKKDLLEWQDKEYLSIQAGLEPKKFDAATGKPIFFRIP